MLDPGFFTIHKAQEAVSTALKWRHPGGFGVIRDVSVVRGPNTNVGLISMQSGSPLICLQGIIVIFSTAHIVFATVIYG